MKNDLKRNVLDLLDYEEQSKLSTHNELLIDPKTNDFYATDEKGNLLDFYEIYKSKLQDDNVISIENTYTINIDMKNIDSDGAVTYADSAENFTPLSIDQNTGYVNYGSWGNLIQKFLGIKPCIFNISTGSVVKYLNPNNFKYDLQGNECTELTEDEIVMIEFAKKYYKIDINNNILTFSVSDKPKEGFVSDAFRSESFMDGYSKYLYIAANSESVADLDFLMDETSAMDNYNYLGYAKYFYLLGLTWLLTKSFSVTIFNTLPLVNSNIPNEGCLFGVDCNGTRVFGIKNLYTTDLLLYGIKIINNTVHFKLHGPYYYEILEDSGIPLPESEEGYGYIDSFLYDKYSAILFPLNLKIQGIVSISKTEGTCFLSESPEASIIIKNGLQIRSLSNNISNIFKIPIYC